MEQDVFSQLRVIEAHVRQYDESHRTTDMMWRLRSELQWYRACGEPFGPDPGAMRIWFQGRTGTTRN